MLETLLQIAFRCEFKGVLLNEPSSGARVQMPNDALTFFELTGSLDFQPLILSPERRGDPDRGSDFRPALGFNPRSTAFQLCGLRQIAQHL